MAGEGQMLRAAREDKKWSLMDTEEITKIRVRYIQALEDEEYGILPGPTYAKGYLRTYAKQLGLNSDEIVALYSSSIATPEATSVLETPHIQTKSRPLWVRPLIIGGMAALTIMVIIAYSLTQSAKKAEESPYTPAALPSAPKIEPVTPSPSTSVSSSSEPITPESSSPDVVTTTQDGLTAQLVFTQPCWIVVKVDGQPLFQETVASGTSKEVKGTSKIELVSIGNAGGVSVTLNGRSLPSLGRSGEVLRNVVLTKDTLNQL